MRLLDKTPTQYITRREIPRLGKHLKDGGPPPTVFVLVSKDGTEIAVWQERTDEEIALMRPLATPEQIATRRVELDNDFLNAGCIRIENVETGDPSEPLRTITEEKAKRQFMAGLELIERNEIMRALKDRENLRLGEFESLRSRVTEFYGSQEKKGGSSISTASAVPESDGLSSEAASSTLIE